MKRLILAIFLTITASLAIAEPTKTTLKDYAFDFASIGYEITFLAETSYFSDPMTSNDYFKVSADGYSIKARADKLTRKGRKTFTSYFNENCKLDFSSRSTCHIVLSGEIELDENFGMIIWATKIEFLDKKSKAVIKIFK